MKKSILEIIRNGERTRGEYFDLYYRKTPDRTLRIGFQIHGYCGNSVIRNKVKRKIRTLIRKRLKSGDYFIRIKTDLRNLTEKDIEREWSETEKKICL